MLENVHSHRAVKGLSRKMGRSEDWLTVKPEEVEERLKAGWEIRRKHKRTISLKRIRAKSRLLESRVWSLLYKMGFTHLSGEGGATLYLGKDGTGPTQQIDVVALDDEVALAIECKTFDRPRKDNRFAEKLTKLASIRGKYARAAGLFATGNEDENERNVATIIFVWDIELRTSDEERAHEEGVRVFDLKDLEYYEELVKHMGVAARYQFLGEIFKGKTIKGLTMKMPALRTKIGKLTCYTFAVRPDYLLKVSYIAHRAKGKPFDVDAYQRMISRSRLKQIVQV